MIAPGKDGYYHPASVEELAGLVQHAHEVGVPLRVRGAEHSVGAAVHCDGFDGAGAPPDGPFEVMMDGLRAVTIHDKGDHAIAEVEGGCHLGRYPYDPPRTAMWVNSLNYQLQRAGWALGDLGGISHQTVTGFMLTGSSGGSVKHTLSRDIVRMLLIDGTGKVHDLSGNDLFHAAGVSMGLLGVVAKVWLRAGKSYNVVGKEVTTRVADCDIDLFGDGNPARKSLAQHLEDTEYCRLLWWPQYNFDRVQVWQGSRQAPAEDFEHKPFTILTKVQALAGSLLMTIIGNLEDVTVVPDKLGDWYRHLEADLDGDEEDVNACAFPQRGGKVELDDVMAELQRRFARAIDRHPELNEGAQHEDEDIKELWKHRGDDADEDEGLPHGLARAIARLFRLAIDEGLDNWLSKKLGQWLGKHMPKLIDNLLTLFVEEGEKEFADSWMCALPMDNQMDDELWPTEFTELWLPIEHTATAMQRLAVHFDAGGDVALAYRRTRAYATELYACGKSPFWMSPAYEKDCFRVDPFWFGHWAGRPNDDMFPPIYDLLADLGWRPHWGKHLPPPAPKWHAHYRKVLPRFEEFLALRKQLDPKDIFLTTYWRENLGIV